MTRALICGIGGQDGAYLAQLLLAKGYDVFGTSRNAEPAALDNLRRLGIADRVQVRRMTPADPRGTHEAVEWAAPHEIYALAGQCSVGLSFEQPTETFESNATGTLNLLEAMRSLAPDARLYHAGSTECFGDLGGKPATEADAFHPRSPYGVAKSAAHMLVRSYRETYGLFACTGILSNHESPLRSERFVTRKIASAAARIAAGADERLTLGNLDISRDWGWAPEFVESMWRMLQGDTPHDLVIATGHSHGLAEFVEAAFAAAGLDWRNHVASDPALMRPAEIGWSGASPALAERLLGWRPAVLMPEIARRMVAAEAEALETAPVARAG
jgi:GDPmannose 4,6-dehydratase